MPEDHFASELLAREKFENSLAYTTHWQDEAEQEFEVLPRHYKHLDPDLFELILKRAVYRIYADAFLFPAQIDEVDIATVLD